MLSKVYATRYGAERARDGSTGSAKRLVAGPAPVPPWEWRKIKKLGVNWTNWLFALTQASNGGDRHTENVPCLRPATVHTTQPGTELREAGHDYPG
jgi:hypothetical protein